MQALGQVRVCKRWGRCACASSGAGAFVQARGKAQLCVLRSCVYTSGAALCDSHFVIHTRATRACIATVCPQFIHDRLYCEAICSRASSLVSPSYRSDSGRSHAKSLTLPGRGPSDV